MNQEVVEEKIKQDDLKILRILAVIDGVDMNFIGQIINLLKDSKQGNKKIELVYILTFQSEKYQQTTYLDKIISDNLYKNQHNQLQIQVVMYFVQQTDYKKVLNICELIQKLTIRNVAENLQKDKPIYSFYGKEHRLYSQLDIQLPDSKLESKLADKPQQLPDEQNQLLQQKSTQILQSYKLLLLSQKYYLHSICFQINTNVLTNIMDLQNVFKEILNRQ